MNEGFYAGNGLFCICGHMSGWMTHSGLGFDNYKEELSLGSWMDGLRSSLDG